MAQIYTVGQNLPMASRWRKRRMCVVDAGVPAPAALENISGRGARISSNAALNLGDALILHHPAAGEIEAHVSGVHTDGIDLVFARSETSVAFALSAIASDMTRAS